MFAWAEGEQKARSSSGANNSSNSTGLFIFNTEPWKKNVNKADKQNWPGVTQSTDSLLVTLLTFCHRAEWSCQDAMLGLIRPTKSDLVTTVLISSEST